MTQPTLERTLTWVHGSALAIGAVLGSGILILPAITAEQAGPASIFAWLLMSVLAFPLAMTLGRLGARHPHAGGIVEYARLAFGATVGRMTAWLFLGTIPIGVPIIALVGADYAASTLGLPAWSVPIMAVVMLLASLALHWRGVNLASGVQILVLLVIAALMVTAIGAAASHIQMSAYHPLAPHGWLSAAKSAVEIFWCFVGWEMVGHLAEEFRDPARDLRRTFVAAPLVVGVLYVALSLVTVGTHAYGSTTDAPLSQLVGTGLGQVGADVAGIAALLVTMVAIHGNVAGFSRMVYSQARAGVFPAALGRLHAQYRTPASALLALGVDFLLVLTMDTTFHVNLGALVKWPSVVFLVIYAVAMASAVKLLKSASRIARASAVMSFMVCLGLYPLSGWATVYPAALGLLGWLISRRASLEPSPSANI